MAKNKTISAVIEPELDALVRRIARMKRLSVSHVVSESILAGIGTAFPTEVDHVKQEMEKQNGKPESA